jgi:hypothetical protein
MKGPLLSEAIKIGASLRPPSHQERFIVVEGRGLCSDVWGAACEAVKPQVAKLNWNPKDRLKFESAMNTLRAVQHQYFGAYFRLPAQCPVAVQRFSKAGARIINRRGDFKIEGEKVFNLGGMTSECDKVEHLAGLVDHLYYKHRNSREEIAQMIEWYEQTRSKAAIFRNFEHYAAVN